jgi:hypothetical protein
MKGKRDEQATGRGAERPAAEARDPGAAAGVKPTGPKGVNSALLAFSGVAVVGVIALAAWLLSGMMRAEREAQGFAAQTIVEVCAAWDPALLARRADPEFMKAMPEAQMRQFIQGAGVALGPGIKAGPTKGKVFMEADTPQGKTVTGEFTSEVECQNGKATIRQVVVKQDGVWRVRAFTVNSDSIKPPQ